MRHAVLISVLVLLLTLPLWLSSYMIHVMILFFLYAYLSQSWNILGGYLGQLSLGHALFFGIGAYTSSLIFVNYNVTPWVGMFIGGSGAALVGLCIGVLCFRYGLKGPYFTLITIAFAEIARLVALHVIFTGGAEGLSIPLHGHQLTSFQFSNKEAYYYIIYGMTAISVGIVYFLKNTSIGYCFLAIREDELAAQAVGVNSMKYKLLAVTISAFMTALGGSFYAQYFLYLEPNSTLGIAVSIDFAVKAVIGGRGTILGPILGSALLTPLAELTRSFVTYGGTGVHLLFFSGILMLVCIFFPTGLIPKMTEYAHSFERYERRQ
jgi:branched-chain amino acid transport system permease protein